MKKRERVRLRDFRERVPPGTQKIGELPKYLTKNPIKEKLIEIFITKILDLIVYSRAETLLDAGTSEGELLLYTKKRFPSIYAVGLDLSLDRLKLANKIVDHTDFILGDINYMPFKSNSFDLVICSEILEHIPDIMKVLNEIYVITRKHFIASVPFSILFRIANLIHLKNVKMLGEAPKHIHRFNKSNFNEILSPKFKVQQIQQVGFIWLVAFAHARKVLNPSDHPDDVVMNNFHQDL